MHKAYVSLFFFFPVAQQPNTGLGRHIVDMSKPQTFRRARAIWILWTSDKLVAKPTTHRQHTTSTRDEHLCPQRDSNPQPQPSSGRRPTLYTARPPEPAVLHNLCASVLTGACVKKGCDKKPVCHVISVSLFVCLSVLPSLCVWQLENCRRERDWNLFVRSFGEVC